MRRAYLDTLLPEEWDSMSLYDRRNFLNGSEFGEQRRTGTVRRMFACNMEIWCECFGRDSSTLKKIDSYEISGIMRKIEGCARWRNGRSPLPTIWNKRELWKEAD